MKKRYLPFWVAGILLLTKWSSMFLAFLAVSDVLRYFLWGHIPGNAYISYMLLLSFLVFICSQSVKKHLKIRKGYYEIIIEFIEDGGQEILKLSIWWIYLVYFLLSLYSLATIIGLLV